MTSPRSSAGLARLYQGLFEHCAEGVILTRPDRSIIRLNPAACRALGASEEALIRAGRAAILVEGPRLEALLALRDASGAASGEIELRRADGTTFPAEATSAVVAGAEPYVITLFRDISERRRVEAELQQTQRTLQDSSDRLRMALDAARAGTWEWDPATRASRWSARTWELLGLRPGSGEANYAALIATVDPEDRPAVDAAVAEALRSRSVFSCEWRVQGVPGPTRWLQARGSPVQSADGAVAYFMGILLDVTERKHTEEARAAERARSSWASEERYRSVMSSMTEGLVVLDASGAVTMCNAAAEAIFGTTLEEMQRQRHPGTTWWSIHEDGTPFPVETHPSTQALRTGAPVRGVLMGVSRPGAEPLWLNVNAEPLRDAEGRTQAVVTTFSDVTARKRADQALRLAEQRLALTVRSGHIGLWDLDLATDTTWRTLQHDQIFGYPQLLPTWSHRQLLEHLHPEDVPMVEAAFAEARSSGRLSFECRLQPREPLPRWIAVEGECFRDPEGRPTRMAGVLMDISARKTSELALQASEARFRALIEGSSDFTMVLDQQGTITFASPASREALGIPPSEVVGDSAFASVHPDDRPRVQEAFEAILRNPADRRRVEFRVRRSSGDVTLLEAEPRNLLHVPGVRGIVVNSRNITEHHRLREQFQQAQKLESVGQLAGGVAHDFNNILGVILGYAGSALSELDEADPLREDLKEIAAAAQRAAALTRQLLAFGRRQILQPVVHAPNDVVRTLEKMLRRLLSEDLVLEVRLAEDAGEVLADPSQVEQVVMNLVVNARDAMGAGGTLTVETAAVEVGVDAAPSGVAPGRYVVLSVSDTGSGMDEATLARIYEPFFTTKEPGKGTGLGLATVYGIVRQSGGFLEVASVVGQGSRFRAYFPRASSAASWRPPAPLDDAGALPGQGTILLVEDDEPLRTYSARTLSRAGYQVLVAASGPEALALAGGHQGTLDLLLTDVVMPGMSGPDVARTLAAGRPGLGVLFVSGYVDQAISPEDLVGSHRSFLPKPYSPAELLNRVRAVLGSLAHRPPGG